MKFPAGLGSYVIGQTWKYQFTKSNHQRNRLLQYLSHSADSDSLPHTINTLFQLSDPNNNIPPSLLFPTPASMASFEIESEPDTTRKPITDDEISPIEQVRLTVSNEDDPSIPVWTFRMWFLGLLSCIILSFLNTFFGYRTEPLVISMISVQVATLPIGRFMANVLPTTTFRIPGFGDRKFSLNPGPFNIKEHVLISIFANAGSAFGNGAAYAIGIVDIVMAFYHRKISFLAGWILVITTQVWICFFSIFDPYE